MKLLWQQLYRANGCAFTAAYARLFRADREGVGKDEDTIRRFDDRHLVSRDRFSCHRPAYDHVICALRVTASKRNELRDGRADSGQHVDGRRNAVAGDGSDAGNQRFPANNPPMHRACRADVLYHATDIGWQAAGWHFSTGDQLNELVLGTGRVDGWHLFQNNAFVAEVLERFD